jgi:hypothetical protein
MDPRPSFKIKRTLAVAGAAPKVIEFLRQSLGGEK